MTWRGVSCTRYQFVVAQAPGGTDEHTTNPVEAAGHTTLWVSYFQGLHTPHPKNQFSKIHCTLNLMPNANVEEYNEQTDGSLTIR